MTYADLTSYFVTLVAIALAPGPVFLMLMVRAASKDTVGALGFGFGYALGGVGIISAVCFGLGAWLTAVPEVFEYSKYAMVAYIAWVARGIWLGGFDLNGNCEAARRPIWRSVGAGMATCLISPYMMVLFPLVLPEMMDITRIVMPDFLIIALATFAALITGSAIIICGAAQLARIAKSPRATLIMNRTLAGGLMTVGGAMAFA